MKPRWLTEEQVYAIAQDEVSRIPSVAVAGPYRIYVQQGRREGQHRLIEIWWDSLVEREDRRFASRGTAVDLADTEEMVRYRIRAMFANDAHLSYVGRYEVSEITVADHPDEPPPYEVQPE